MSLEPSVRYIAPDDFTTTLARGLRVELGKGVTLEMIQLWAGEGEAIVSTIPMPVLMKIVGWDTGLHFEHQPIWSLRTRITHPFTEVYQTIYYPGDEPWYRASITGDLLIIESLQEIPRQHADIPVGWAETVLRSDFGIQDPHYSFPTVHHQSFGKIAPCEDSERKAFILAMTDKWGLYSLGRFGTWRQILLDDLVQDIRIIDAMISERSIYNRHMLFHSTTPRKGGLVP
jgi:hypothetical protein